MSATITPLPTPPSRAVPATFSTLADAFLGALPTFQAQANVLASEAEADAVTAATQAQTATEQAAISTGQAAAASNSATAAAAAVNAPIWVSGTTYAIGECRWSPANYAVYRRKTAGAGTVDPSTDTTNWIAAIPPSLPFSDNEILAQNHAITLCF